ncbi:hypothetical protein HGA34_04455 [Candidatus Falkowbacteria bacterium]|nr:hypothetical protein [Candidatus Falkowbacteria bacterium]
MKRLLLSVSLLATLASLAWGGYFYWHNLRGASLALRSPKVSIVELFERSRQIGTTTVELPLKLPPGFTASIFAKDLDGPRVLAYDPTGKLLVSLPKSGKVVALADKDGDAKADSAVEVVTGLDSPHGVAVRCYADNGTKDCKLFIAETDQLAAYDYDTLLLKATNKKKLMELPAGSGHSTRTVKVGPDERLYVSIGSSCNVCHEKDDRRAKIFSLKPDGTDVRESARGLRNSVFFEWSYVDGRMWATDMGRDLLGDDLPPDEINIIETGGSGPKNYGWPTCYGKNIHDTDFDKNTYIRNPCQEPTEVPSYIDIPAHSAPLGLAFVPEEGWPEAYWYNLLVAYHGSWNRTKPTGYKVVRVKLDAKGNYLGTEDFITGWLLEDNKSTLGRPVDILLSPGGLMYLSDDGAGVIYRVTYNSENAPSSTGQLPRPKVLVESPQPGTAIASPLEIRGQAYGTWFFEASFPIKLVDADGKALGQAIAQAQSDWMTEKLVGFKAVLEFTVPTSTDRGVLIFSKDNPSGLPEHDDSFEVPVKFKQN